MEFGISPPQRGFTLIEVLVYTAILASIAVITVGIILRVNVALGHIRVVRSLDAAAAVAMERTIRVIRDAKAVDTASSLLEVSPGLLLLTGAENPALAHRFSLSGGSMQYQRGADAAIALTPPRVTVTGLVFRATTTPASSAVRVELTLAAFSGRATTTQTFYGTAVLRNSYAQ